VGDFFFKKREILEFAINKEGSSDIKRRQISLICENTPYFKKIFENMAAVSGSLRYYFKITTMKV
jgi:hypothetical protein